MIDVLLRIAQNLENEGHFDAASKLDSAAENLSNIPPKQAVKELLDAVIKKLKISQEEAATPEGQNRIKNELQIALDATEASY